VNDARLTVVGAAWEPATDRVELNALTLILWRYLARKLKFPNGTDDVTALAGELGDVLGGLPQKRG
jgi:hypothetical protein